MTSATAAGHDMRLLKLKARTALTGVAMMVCAVGAIKLAAAALGDMQLGQTIVPGPFDVSMASIASVPMEALNRASFGFLVLSVLLYSVTPLARKHVIAVLGGAAFLCTVSVLASAPTERILSVIPSQLEGAMMLGRFDLAERLLEEGENSAEKHYVKAQIDLRAGDLAALRISAPPVLALSDHAHDTSSAGRKNRPVKVPSDLVPEVRNALSEDPDAALAKYGEAVVRSVDPDQNWGSPFSPVEPGSVFDYAGVVIAREFQPEVIHALDVGLNGRARSRLGLRWALQHPDQRAAPSPRQTLAMAAAALALLLACALLAVLWNAMRRRVWTVDRKLTFRA